ncbi:hypothetical protein RA262_27855, partial [Pseudomonas syringae pv. tagetis]
VLVLVWLVGGVVGVGVVGVVVVFVGWFVGGWELGLVVVVGGWVGFLVLVLGLGCGVGWGFCVGWVGWGWWWGFFWCWFGWGFVVCWVCFVGLRVLWWLGLGGVGGVVVFVLGVVFGVLSMRGVLVTWGSNCIQ